MRSFWKSVHARLLDGQQVFVALVVEHSPHSPGTTGARLAVLETGEVAGTIGGGVMEYDLVDWAKKVLRGAPFSPELKKLVHSAHAAGEKSGMICAGHQTNLYYLCRPAIDTDAVGLAADVQDKDGPGIMEISPHGMRFVEAGRPRPTSPQHLLVREPTGWRYAEQLLNLKRAAIFGAGHCGRALSFTLHRLGYHVSVFDTRRELTSVPDLDVADHVEVVSNFTLAGQLPRYPAHTDAVVMTTNTESDVSALLGIVLLPFAFVGVMGSNAKIGTIKKTLRDAGIAPHIADGITAPVGLPIGSNTPEEIAVSVAAQLIQRRSQHVGPTHRPDPLPASRIEPNE